MTGLRSSATFRSNIYPTSTNGALVNDRRFLDAISDPEALDILWRYNGSQGAKLNPLQRRQHEMAVHCAYAEEDDFPWGTPVGGNRVVCLCERVDCPRYRIECSKFHPAGFVPKVHAEASAPQKGTKGNGVPKGYSAAEMRGAQRNHPMGVTAKTSAAPKPATPPVKREKPSAARRSSVTFVSASAARQRSQQASQLRTERAMLATWTHEEDIILREMYPIYGISVRKWTKRLPDRSTGEILDRAHELKVRYIPQRERAASRGNTVLQPVKSGDGMSRAEKRRHRERMRRRPWDTKEDAILRKYYPTYGAEMEDWPQKLSYRTKPSIEARARELGLRLLRPPS